MLSPINFGRFFRRWAWLMALSAFAIGGLAFVAAMRQPPIYRTKTTVSIGNYLYSPNPSSLEIRTGIDLAYTYAEIVKTYDVLQGTVDALSLPISADTLRSQITSQITVGTSLLEIEVVYNDPVLVADIANTLVEQLIANSPTNLSAEQQEQLTFLQAQIEDLSGQIDASRERLQRIEVQLDAATESAVIDRLTTERSDTISQITVAQTSIAQFTNTVASLQQRSNTVEVIERARIPGAENDGNAFQSAIIGAALGLVASGVLALLIDDLDDTIHNSEDATQSLMLPVLGAITRFGKKNKPYSDMLITHFPSLSPIAEGYRSVRTNLLFSDQPGNKRVFIVTSANQQEGKTITAVNLAIVLAQADMRVLLVDADLRRPRIHDAFNLKNEIGLTSLLNGEPPQTDSSLNSTTSPSSLNFKRCTQSTGIPHLRAMTSGFIPANPSEILGSTLLREWIEAFLRAPDIDIVIIDTPPVLAVADSQILAASTGAEVILVVDCNHTKRGAALRAKEQFLRLGIEPKGVIVNRINPTDEPYAYYYGYYSPQKRRRRESSDQDARDHETEIAAKRER